MNSEITKATARAVLTATLITPIPSSKSITITRDDIDKLLSSIESTLSQCTSQNIKASRELIETYITNSQPPKRWHSLMIYFSTIAPLFNKRRKILYLLYLLNDIFYSSQLQNKDIWIDEQVHLQSIIGSAWECKTNREKLIDLLSIWKDKGYYSSIFNLNKNSNPSISTCGDSKLQPQSKQTLGNIHYPFYNQPASTMLPHISSDPTEALNPRNITPLQIKFDNNTDAENINKAVDSFYQNINWHKENKTFNEIETNDNQLFTYDGWSQDFVREFKHVQLLKNKYSSSS